MAPYRLSDVYGPFNFWGRFGLKKYFVCRIDEEHVRTCVRSYVRTCVRAYVRTTIFAPVYMYYVATFYIKCGLFQKEGHYFNKKEKQI